MNFSLIRIATGMVQQAAFFDITITKLSWAAGIYLLFSGVSTALLMVCGHNAEHS
jgi:hypothetical protein